MPPPRSLARRSNIAAVFTNAARTSKANYRSDYSYHAQMEPLNGVARFNATGDRVEVWEGTQTPGASCYRTAGRSASNRTN